MSSSTGVYLAESAPSMRVHATRSFERSHCQDDTDSPPSGSVALAVRAEPARGGGPENVTVPCSSVLVTSMVTTLEDPAREGSTAATDTVYRLLLSKSRPAPVSSCPDDGSIRKCRASLPLKE